MGTRSITKVYDEDGKTIISMYRQMDGYPTGHGRELKEFLTHRILVNGIGLNQNSTIRANGMNDLAAQLVCHFKSQSEVGGIYLYPPKPGDLGEEYTYAISHNMNTWKLEIFTHYSRNRRKIFSGSIDLFNPEQVEKEVKR